VGRERKKWQNLRNKEFLASFGLMARQRFAYGCMHMFMGACICLYIYIYIYMEVYVYVYVRVYVYV